MASDGKAVIARRLRARPNEVFEACTDPKLLALWLGPKAFEVCEVSADARVGGRFSLRMKDGQGTHRAEGVYQEITPPTRVVLTWAWTEAPEGSDLDGLESLVTFELRADGDGTLLTLTHDRLRDQASADNHREGWTEAVDKLEQLLRAE